MELFGTVVGSCKNPRMLLALVPARLGAIGLCYALLKYSG